MAVFSVFFLVTICSQVRNTVNGKTYVAGLDGKFGV